MRPGLWGARLVAHKLLAHQLPTTIISDNTMGFFFARNRVRRVFLFCSELGREGPAGICGLLLTALLAHVHKVPVELLAADDDALPALDSDVTTFLGHRTCPQDVKAYPLTHDVAPWHLFHNS
jgi:methylthioribose-1-phosphate isomerase